MNRYNKILYNINETYIITHGVSEYIPIIRDVLMFGGGYE